MKSLQNFLFELSELDVRLWVDGDRLRCNAPQVALTPAIRAELAERKAEILKFLNQANLGACSTLEPIKPVPRDGKIPLSFGQQGLWFLDQLERQSIAYNQLFAIHLNGSLNVAVLEQAITEIIRRHEILRTTFNTSDGQPVQVIAPNLNFRLSVVDLLGLPEANQLAEFQHLAISELERPFHLAQLPLLRVTLLQLKESEHVLLFTIHHIIGDGWSGGIIIRELGALYKALLTGEPCALPELSIQYADFAYWQQQWLREVAFAEQLTYWKQQLAGAHSVLQLPSDRPRPAIQTFRGATTTLKVEADVAQRLKQFSQQEGATLFMTLLASFQVLLYRYTNQDDICIGTTLANRRSRELELLIGFFVNTVVLRTNLSGNPSFQELLGRVRRVALEAYKHPDFPFNLLVEKLQPERNLSNTPLFQVMFVLENAPTDTLELPGLTLSPLEIPIKTAKFDLTLSMRETEQGLFGTFEYNTDLFDADTITRMVGHFQTLLSAIAANPQQCLCELPLLTEAEQYQLLREWNDTQAEYPLDQCIHQLFEAQMERTPDAVAVVFEDEQLTYRQLNQRANQLAHYLKTLTVKPEVLVGICVERSIEMVVGLLGILKAGGAYVPLDPAYPQQRLALMVSDAQMPVLLTQKRLLSKLPEHQARVVCLDRDWHTISQESQDNPASNTTPDNLAYIIYTSGSTGKPKGVQIPHGAVVNFLTSMQHQPGLTQTDVLLAVTSISFDIAALELYLPLITGARVALVSREVASDGKQLIEQLQSSGATVMQATPASWQMLLATGWQGSPQLKILCGGEALPRDLAQQLLATGAAVWNLYGPTETTIWSTVYQIEAAKLVKATVPIGQPIANTQVHLLDSWGQPVPIGVPGELHIGGAGLARGYLNRPELTFQKFIHHPVAGRLYKTGDLARYLADGTIEYIERIDHQVKLRGFRIELGEIEALLRQHPAVEQAVVMLREDEPGNQRLVAYIVTQSSQDELAQQLRRFVGEQLPSYMVPSLFVTLEALPLTPNGKVDRKALPVPEATRTSPQEAFVLPRNPVEEVLAGIWSQLLGIEQVGIDDNFFELGGHSLLATQVMSWIENAFGVELPVRCLFESPTLAALSEEIQEAIKAEPSLNAPPIKPVSWNKDLPLSFSQQRMWFLNQIEGESATYNESGILKISGRLQIVALEQSFREIMQRHEALRTSFQTINGQPIQIIFPTVTFTLPVVDLLRLPQAEQDAEVQRLITQEVQRPFDLSQNPLWRVTLLQLGQTEYLLQIVMHHIVSDAWSVGVLFRELTALYEAFSKGQPSPLPNLPIQYADFAVWQRQYLQGEVLERELSYWKQQLKGATTSLQLPTDRPRPPVPTFAGKKQYFLLPKTLTEALKATSREVGATLFMTLLAAFNTLLYRYTGQEDILVGSPIANRNRAEIENLIGVFINTLVLRTNLSGNPTFSELLGRVREVTLGAYEHQDFPVETLLEELQLERNSNQTNLFQVGFVLQNAPMPALELPDLTISLLEVDTGMAKLDLTLYLKETDQGLSGSLEYKTGLFDAATITRIIGHFQILLEGIVANPNQRLSELPILTAAELQQLLVEWNDTRSNSKFKRSQESGVRSQELGDNVNASENPCVHQLFEAQVEQTPDAVAVVFEDKQLTYRQLNQKANQLACYLRSLGVKPEVLVGICVERSLEMVVGLLGILKAGGAYLPLDPAYPQERLALMMADARVPVLLTKERLMAELPAQDVNVVCLDGDWERIARESPENVVNLTTPENLAYVIYTSGSTGKPKGVLIQHSSLVSYTETASVAYAIKPSDRILQFASISFDTSAEEIYPCLVRGATLVLRTPSMLDSISTFVQKSQDWNLTVLNLPTAYWHELAACLEAEALTLPPSLRLVIIGGEKVLPARLVTWHQYVNRRVQLINTYGPTEATIVAAMCDLSELTAFDATSQEVPIGRPIPNVQMYILDRHLQPVPIGIPGELHIGGIGLARGYLNAPELSAEKFIPNPFQTSREAKEDPLERLYKTGDKARYLSDGTIEFLGRVDHQVKIRGFRVELGEIEATLNQHPAVKETVVVAREDVPGQKRLTAYVVQNLQPQSLADQSSEAEQISQWQTVYEEGIFNQADSLNTFNISGWYSSYTGELIPEAEMQQWVNHTVDRILSLKPNRVLEIGCGMGLLLFRIAPHCLKYCGTDFSAAALRYTQNVLDLPEYNLPQVTLCQKMADNFEGIEAHDFDALIINSVTQHFPSIDYLVRVLEGAVKAVESGGFIFVGDVRSLPLLEAFHTSVQLYKAPSSLSIAQLQQRIQQRIAQERELVLDPAFFMALKHYLPAIRHVQILPKRGRYHNELTKFRYDVILHLGVEVTPISEFPWLDWQEQGLTLASVCQLLEETQPKIIGITRVPNARIVVEVKTLDLLTKAENVKTVSDLHKALSASPQEAGVEPEDLWDLSQTLPYFVEIDGSSSGVDGYFDVVFRRRTTPRSQASSSFQETASLKPWNAYANNPLQTQLASDLIPQLRDYVKKRLPEYMMPSAFVLLEALPLMPNGKVDRRALPAPDSTRPELNEAFTAPRTPVEEMLAGIWAKVLNVEQVGIHDNFFELGGHSLLATQVISQVHQAFRVELPLRCLFDAPTVAGLSDWLEGMIGTGSKLDVSPIERIPRHTALPLSFAQQRLWFLERLQPGNCAYNIAVAVHLHGSLNVIALEQSLNEIVRHHEILRTTFVEVEGQPRQVIAPELTLTLPVVNLQDFPPDERETEVMRLGTEEAQCPFDLTKSPLLRGTVLQLDPANHVLLFTMHHIVSDGWSMGVLIRELTTLYAAFNQGNTVSLPELPIQYADFAIWQRQWLQAKMLETQLAYWKQQLDGAPSLLQLPTDRPRPPIQTFRGARHILNIPKPLTEALKALSRQEGVTLFMTLLAAFKTLLHHYTEQNDILVGSPIANRNRPEIEELIGFFVNTLVLRTDLGGNPSFRELLQRVREVALGAYAHQDIPFEQLVNELQVERDLSHNSLFQVWFVLQNAPIPPLELTGLTLNPLAIDTGTARHDLNLNLSETPEGLNGFFEYKTDLFDATTIARMAQQFELLLRSVVEQPDAKLNVLKQTLAETEKQQQLVKEKEFKQARSQKLGNISRRAIHKN